MRDIRIILCAVLAMLLAVYANAQEKNDVVQKKDSTKVEYPVSDVEKIHFSEDSINVEAIDLGLSVKWASCNVGASSPEEYGGYYAWGETEEKSDYDWDTYAYYDNTTDYCINIGSDIAGTNYDVAHVKWGGSWRMPNREQIIELCNKCTWTWMEYNGVYGQMVTGSNGNSIFLPAAGYRSDTSLLSAGTHGIYWSSTANEECSNYASDLYFFSGYDNYWCGWINRSDGWSVRPVTE